MSSEGSISSRISQFGLYRTIDARTEEFLKLSKRRQIRQGCVCAAISTAVTVTVVVSTLLVYEYNVINEAKRTDGKLNWLDLMNSSVNDPILQERFNKANIKIDKTTLKLLPILLNALSHNKYTGKNLDVSNTIYPSYEIRDTTDHDYKKNIFADTRNWMKMPQSRLYIEYKTSPMVYFKNPTRNVDYFTKIRKIRDHQRILKYVNKMIQENKKDGLTEPMKSYTEVPLKATIPIVKHIPRNKTTPVARSAKLSTEKKSNCKCPHKLMELMKKLLTSIQTLLSYLSGSSSTESLPYLKTFIEMDSTKASTSRINLESTTRKTFKENHEEVESETSQPSPYKTFLNRHKYNVDFTNSYDLRRDHTIKTMMNLMKPNYSKFNPYKSEFEPTESFDTIQNYNIYSKTMSPTKEVTDEASTVSLLQYTAPKSTDKSTDSVTTIADYILQKGTYDLPSSGTTSVVSKFTENDFDEDDEYTETTATYVKNFNDLNASLEINKSKKTESKESSSEIEKTSMYNLKGARINEKLYTDIGLIRKFGNLAPKYKSMKTFSPVPYRFAPISRLISNPTTFRTTPSTNYPKYLNSTRKPTTITLFKTNKTNPQSNKITENKVRVPKQDQVNKITLKVDTKQVLKIDRSKEAVLDYVDDAITIHSNKTTNHAEPIAAISDDTNQWELVESEERKSSIKSMIPQSRPTYLEMQRNDWRQDDNHDYDNEIVLLIYEYMIVVETTLVQNRRSLKRNKTIPLSDQPIADRLDRSYFGFDQDYYERMPLLVNALQENSYIDPSTEVFEISNKKRRFPNMRNIKLTTERYRAIRRTSPRPFLYEYRNPIPAPFSKTQSKSYTSRSWVESYRNAQRLKNLNEIIKYLEQTINAKFGDLKTQTSTRIAFSGIYVEPYSNEHKDSGEHDLTAVGSYKQEYKSNHLFDPLYTFKPDHPGEINLLAEGLRFAPTPTLHFVSEIMPTVPMFKPIPNRKNNCLENPCNDKQKGNVRNTASSSSENTDINTLKSFGVMLNLYPFHSDKSSDVVSTTIRPATAIDKIYITTARPKFQFRRKTSFPVRRTYVRGRPRFSSKIKHTKNNISKSSDKSHLNDVESTTIPKMVVHVNVYSVNKEKERPKNITETLISNSHTETTSSTTTSTYGAVVDIFSTLNSSHVEDYHVGSSGVIPFEERTVPPPTFPILTPIIPLFDTTTISYEAPKTEPPDVIKFSPEDAKIPDQYLNIRKSDGTQMEVTEMARNFEDSAEFGDKDVESRTLVVKLKNYDTSSDETSTRVPEEIEEVTQTYVPQINGHYRNIIHKSLSTLLRENSERYRRKLENSISAIRKSTYVPMYVEIRRNHTSSQIDNQ